VEAKDAYKAAGIDTVLLSAEAKGSLINLDQVRRTRMCTVINAALAYFRRLDGTSQLATVPGASRFTSGFVCSQCVAWFVFPTLLVCILFVIGGREAVHTAQARGKCGH
jgi:hypothetical protein